MSDERDTDTDDATGGPAVVAPTRREMVVYTVVVLLFVAFMITLVGLLDVGFQKLTFALFG